MTDATRISRMEILFIVLAIAGLLGTGAQLPPYFKLGFVPGNVQFWKDTFATPASTFIVVDIFVLGAAVLIWMFGECRRLAIAAGWAWAYFLASALIGISFAFPLFLAHRQRRLRLQRPQELSAPAGADLAGAAIALGLMGAVLYYSFTHIHIPGGAAVVPPAEHARAQALKMAGPTVNSGIESVKNLGVVPLKGEITGADDRVLRARELVIAPGGVVAVHQHDHRPGVAYILEGEMTEMRGEQAEAIMHGAGAAAFEWTGVTHWWENRGAVRARAIVVDIVPAS